MSNPIVISSGPAERLDRLPVTLLHAIVLTASGLGFASDMLEMSLGGVLSAVFSAPPHALSARALSWVLSAPYIGAVLGAPMIGRIADRYGPARSLAGVTLALALLSLSISLSKGITTLFMFRVLAGIALGAYPPLAIAYLTEVLPPLRRGTLTLIQATVASLGPPLGLLLVHRLSLVQTIGVESWRWGFALCAVGAAVAAVIFLRVPESPRWLLASGDRSRAEHACDSFEKSGALAQWGSTSDTGMSLPEAKPARRESLWRPAPAHRSRWLLFGAALMFVSSWATSAFPILNGALLISKGLKVTDTLLYLGIANFGPSLGTLAAAFVIERMERRTATVVYAVIGALSACIFAAISYPPVLIASSLALSLAISVYIPSALVYISELFVSGFRSSATATAWTFNRIGSALAPLVLVPLLRGGGVLPVATVMVGALGVTIILLAVIGPRGMAGQTVD